MKMIKRRWWWVYLNPESDFERETLDWLSGYVDPEECRISAWLNENATSGWRADAKVRYLKGDDREYIAIRFADQSDALMFLIAFETQAPRVQGTPPEWKSWSAQRQSDRKAPTFEKSCTWSGFRAPPKRRGKLKGKDVVYWWSIQRNAVGYFLGWRTIDDCVDPESYIARRKRNAVKDWVARNTGVW